MAIDRIGSIPEMKCPDLDLPEMEREGYPEMESAGIRGKNRRRRALRG